MEKKLSSTQLNLLLIGLCTIFGITVLFTPFYLLSIALFTFAILLTYAQLTSSRKQEVQASEEDITLPVQHEELKQEQFAEESPESYEGTMEVLSQKSVHPEIGSKLNEKKQPRKPFKMDILSWIIYALIAVFAVLFILTLLSII